MTHGSLFSGIGGFDLAAEWMGWENVFHCEWNEFGQKILKYYWPNATSYGDITKTDFTIWRGRVDVLSGGFPCQPYSTAGKRLGKEDDRHLWPEMLRAIREIQPRWVVGENVLGLVNWSGGLVFHEVQTDLETEGYEVQPYILPACGVGAIHRRERVWFVAKNSNYDGRVCEKRETKSGFGEQRNISTGNDEWLQTNDGETGFNTHNNCKFWRTWGENRREKQSRHRKGLPETFNSNPERIGQPGQGRAKRQVCTKENGDRQTGLVNSINGWPSQPPVYCGDDGIPERLDSTSISEKQWLEESLKGFGNAIVPQVALQLFKAIEQFENIK